MTLPTDTSAANPLRPSESAPVIDSIWGPASWSGVFPATLTMFTAAGELDVQATGAHFNKLIDDGAHGLVVGGTSSEFIGLDGSERRLLLEIAAAAVGGRVPLVVGTGYFATKQTIDLTRHAEAIGADGAMVILPYYQKPTRAEVIGHYKAIGQATRLPVMIYNNPANSGAVGLDAPTIRSLYEGGYARAVKSTFATVQEVHELRAELDDGFRVFYGSFQAPLEALAGGAHGWISGILNVASPDAVALWNAIQAGDLTEARLVWRRILWIKQLYTRQLLGDVSDLAIYRGILRLRGETAGYCRRPLVDLDAEQMASLASLMERREREAGDGVPAV